MATIASQPEQELIRRIEKLESQVSRLVAEVGRLSKNAGASPLVEPASSSVEPADDAAVSHLDLGQLKAANLLSTVAAVSFLLAIALVLRTLVDSGTVGRQIGSYVGLAYAFMLLVLGHIRYTRAHRAVPVYSVCGTLLLFSIVIEGHLRFGVLPPPIAYLVLSTALIVTVLLGVRHDVPTLAIVGLLGATVAGLVLEFPAPVFPLLAVLILLANILVRFAIRLEHCRWLNGTVLLLTAFFWTLWAIRVTHAAGAPPGEAHAAWASWYMPTLGVFGGWYLFVAGYAGAGGTASRGRFETALPVFVAALAYPVALAYAHASGTVQLSIAVWVFPAAIVMTLLAFGMSRVKDRPRGTAVSFVLAALLVLCLSLRELLRAGPQTLLCCTALGLLCLILSIRWRSHGLRIAAYLIQVYTLLLALADSAIMSVADPSIGSALPLGALAFAALGHFYLAHRYPLDTGRTTLMEPEDRLAVVPVLLALVYAFGIARVGWYILCSGADNAALFQAGQSLELEAGGILVALFALRYRSRDLALTAIAIALLGAAKVFTYDLTHIQGVPLVVSVCSVGFTASIGALLWKRWQSPAPKSAEV